MGKYIRKSKTMGGVALMEVSHAQSSLGVRTRAKTLALQRLQKSTVAAPSMGEKSDCSYLQLRSRRLEKPPILMAHSDSKRQKNPPKGSSLPNAGSRASSGLKVCSVNSRSGGSVSLDCLNKEKGCLDAAKTVDTEENDNSGDMGIETSFGENVLEFEGRERSTRETTPCSLIRGDPGTVRTPGSATRPNSLIEPNCRVQNSMRRHVPTSHEMDQFFSGAEEHQQREFIDKYNFDPVKDEPLPGRYEWVKVDP